MVVRQNRSSKLLTAEPTSRTTASPSRSRDNPTGHGGHDPVAAGGLRQPMQLSFDAISFGESAVADEGAGGDGGRTRSAGRSVLRRLACFGEGSLSEVAAEQLNRGGGQDVIPADGPPVLPAGGPGPERILEERE